MAETLLQSAAAIWRQASADHPPFATVLMFSGGDDSLTALYAAQALGIPIDFLMHVDTGTGIPETTRYVRSLAAALDLPYIEESAGRKFEAYVLRKGFFGRGHRAHAFAYHLLKNQQFTTGLSKRIRQRKHHRTILLLNGARRQESARRSKTMPEPVRVFRSNVWVNLIHEWSKVECMDFLHQEKARRNPVTQFLHRSGECMCGTMQSHEERREAAYWFPAWGDWLLSLEAHVKALGFPWGWGDEIPPLGKGGKGDPFTAHWGGTIYPHFLISRFVHPALRA